MPTFLRSLSISPSLLVPTRKQPEQLWPVSPRQLVTMNTAGRRLETLPDLSLPLVLACMCTNLELASSCTGSVLIPVDTAGRMLETLLVLAGAWERLNIPQPLVLLTHVALTVLELARSQLEWLADGLSKALASARGPVNPFTCRCAPAAAGC